jgi:hypothetical protein
MELNKFIEEFDTLYKNIIGDYNIVNARGFIPVSYHGSQVKEEFSHTWFKLMHRIVESDKDEIFFLEVGAYKGLWPLMFSKVCSLYNKIPHYSTVTLVNHDDANISLLDVKDYYEKNNWTFNLIDKNSNLETTKDELCRLRSEFDFVFIDADHRYEFAKKDMELYTPLCTDTLIFHDVKPRIATQDVGVWKAISELNLQPDEEFSTNELNYGLGLKYINT